MEILTGISQLIWGFPFGLLFKVGAGYLSEFSLHFSASQDFFIHFSA